MHPRPTKGTTLPGSTQDRFERSFADNPGEELTFEDIAAKFDVTVMRARELVKVAKTRMAIESVHVVRLASKGRAS
jgi:hypothetical protein